MTEYRTKMELPINQIICGDCLEVMKDWPDGCVDLVLTDPPYGTTACKWDSVIPLDLMWEQVNRITKTNAATVFTASQPFTASLIASNMPMFRHEWIWIKNRGSNFLNTKREPMKEHESVVVFSPGGWTFNRQLEERAPNGFTRAKMKLDYLSNSENYGKLDGLKSTFIGDKRVPKSYQRFDTVAGEKKTKHPTQKPVSLMEYMVKTYSCEGDVVLDICSGSGTTCVAAKMLGRNYIGIDISEEYCQIARDRLAAVDTGVPVKESRAGQMALFNSET